VAHKAFAIMANSPELHIHEVAKILDVDSDELERGFMGANIPYRKFVKEEPPLAILDEGSSGSFIYQHPDSLTEKDVIELCLPVCRQQAAYWFRTNAGFYGKIQINQDDMTSYLLDYVVMSRLVPTVRANPIHYLGFRCPDCGAQISPKDTLFPNQDWDALRKAGKIRLDEAVDLDAIEPGSGIVQCLFERRQKGVSEAWGGCGLIMPFSEWPTGDRGASLVRSCKTACHRAMMTYHRFHYDGPRGIPHREAGYHDQALEEGDVDFACVSRIVTLDALGVDPPDAELQYQEVCPSLRKMEFKNLIDKCPDPDVQRFLVVVGASGAKTPLHMLRRRMNIAQDEWDDLISRTRTYYQHSHQFTNNASMDSTQIQRFREIALRAQSDGRIVRPEENSTVLDIPDVSREALIRMLNSLPDDKLGIAAQLLEDKLGANEVVGLVAAPSRDGMSTDARIRRKISRDIDIEYHAVGLTLGIEINSRLSPFKISQIVRESYGALSDEEKDEIPAHVRDIIQAIIEQPSQPTDVAIKRDRRVTTNIRNIQRPKVATPNRPPTFSPTRLTAQSIRLLRVGASTADAYEFVKDNPRWLAFLEADGVSVKLLQKRKMKDGVATMTGGVLELTSPNFHGWDDTTIAAKVSDAFGPIPTGHPQEATETTSEASTVEDPIDAPPTRRKGQEGISELQQSILNLVKNSGKATTTDVARAIGQKTAATHSSLQALQRKNRLTSYKPPGDAPIEWSVVEESAE
jgi:hypothetical protein